MSMTIREQLLAVLRHYPDSTSVKLSNILGMTTKRISSSITTLLADGLISRDGEYGGRTYRLTDYGLRYAPMDIPSDSKARSRLVPRTASNVICQECMQSATMKRVLSMYGRISP